MSTRRILSVKRIREEFDLISFEDGGYLYERHTPNRWRFIISALGGSVELVRDDTDLEESYQQWLEERKEKETMDVEKLKTREPGERTISGHEVPTAAPIAEARYPKHIDIVNALGRMENQIRNLGQFCTDVDHGLNGKAEEPLRKDERLETPTVTHEEPPMSLSQFLSETQGYVSQMTEALEKHIAYLRGMLF